MIDVYANKNTFLKLCKNNIHRKGINNLLDWLCETDFFVAPASSHYHLSEIGGLCQHSLNVYNHMVRDVQQIMSKEEKMSNEILEQVTILSLFHDFVKINLYEENYKNIKKSYGWTEEKYYIINNKSELYGHGITSARIITKFIDLTDKEYMAIVYHMGFGSDDARTNPKLISDVYNNNIMAVLLNIADTKATFIDEREE